MFLMYNLFWFNTYYDVITKGTRIMYAREFLNECLKYTTEKEMVTYLRWHTLQYASKNRRKTMTIQEKNCMEKNLLAVIQEVTEGINAKNTLENIVKYVEEQK